MNSVELFAGAGGLALGTAYAGFEHRAVVEFNADACSTLTRNREAGVGPMSDWKILHSDVRAVDWSRYTGATDMVSGGPPCQPFSIAGKHRGFDDSRNMFPALMRVVRALKPRVVLVENVKGLLRDSFAKYFEYIVLQLSYPELTAKPDEKWQEHLSRLERHHTSGVAKGLCYRAVFQCVNAASYGVPQKRERVFIVAFRSDHAQPWAFPRPTHSEDALLHDQFVTMEYWERHRIAKKHRPATPERLRKRVEYLASSLLPPSEQPYATVRDALVGLPEPASKQATGVRNHVFMPGARTYPGHTGSPIDSPAKTLKAGDHGVPGCEIMVLLPSGEVRYFTVRESARLQTFPDEYVFEGAWSEAMRQLGNAVPVTLARTIASSIHKSLNGVQ